MTFAIFMATMKYIIISDAIVLRWMHKFKNGHESIVDACKSYRKCSIVTDKTFVKSSVSLTKMPNLHLPR
jgi:hypothetical protein